MARALLLYEKKGCHLCEVAAETVARVCEALSGQVETSFERFDIARDPALVDLYKYEIPVLLLDGRPVFRLRVDPEALRALLEKSDV